ncbi:hypothetical protein CY34DRAFT_809262 [Suillus luteus UH-Slu-Lm8-n1]|uniref:Uncharacterized protein n=1 Tax=Suillus luteus UH-Slu-Lm8-n1 TaxID=930992 RepID=A0A0C9ZLW0_9AGAM|nr:hypothetical protein CY34DRAFT_809262 [Suillus luteus UH-Slu-Lm8-n1]
MLWPPSQTRGISPFTHIDCDFQPVPSYIGSRGRIFQMVEISGASPGTTKDHLQNSDLRMESQITRA